jgi:hypothetical protein
MRPLGTAKGSIARTEVRKKNLLNSVFLFNFHFLSSKLLMPTVTVQGKTLTCEYSANLRKVHKESFIRA